MARERWGSKLGVILAVAGSAVGLGNFLRFPGMAAANGGGAFLIPYFIAVLLLGIPLMWVEWTIGRFGGGFGHSTAPGAFHNMARKNRFVKYFGVIGIFGPLVILMFYLYVESWLLGYSVFSITGKYEGCTSREAITTFLSSYRGEVDTEHFKGIGTAYLFFLATFVVNIAVVWFGVKGGIEKFCKFAMPVLLALAVVLLVRVVTLPPQAVAIESVAVETVGMLETELAQLNDDRADIAELRADVARMRADVTAGDYDAVWTTLDTMHGLGAKIRSDDLIVEPESTWWPLGSIDMIVPEGPDANIARAGMVSVLREIAREHELVWAPPADVTTNSESFVAFVKLVKENLHVARLDKRTDAANAFWAHLDDYRAKPTVNNGFGYLWNPKWTYLKKFDVWLAAAGQVFFTLSVGIGSILTYASYLRRRDDVALSGLTAATTNEFAEIILGGSIVIPAAFVFFGAHATQTTASQGTFDLGFLAMPMVLQNLPAGNIFGFLWFFLLFLAGVTSSISLAQPAIAFLEDEFNLSRKEASFILGIVTFILCHVAIFAWSTGAGAELDFWGGTMGLVVFGLIEAIMFGWVFGIDKAWTELHAGSDITIPRIYRFIIKYVTPVFLIVILVGWLVQFGVDTILLKDVPREKVPVVVLTRVILLLLFATICFLVWAVWKRRTRDESDTQTDEKVEVTQ